MKEIEKRGTQEKEIGGFCGWKWLRFRVFRPDQLYCKGFNFLLFKMGFLHIGFFFLIKKIILVFFK
jgi:hypothetical protein